MCAIKKPQNGILTRLQAALRGTDVCVSCGQTGDGTSVCAVCLADWLPLQRAQNAYCPMCAEPSTDGVLCGACQHKPCPQRRTFAAYRYAPPLTALIHAYKFRHQSHLYAALVQLMQQNRPNWLPEAVEIDTVMAMPLSRQRLNQRGFNQSALLAQALAKDLNLPLLSPFVVKRGHRPPQSTLPADERWHNVRGAFRVLQTEHIAKRHILLIDDVMTTGATLHELARTLQQAGAASVCAWVLAKGD